MKLTHQRNPRLSRHKIMRYLGLPFGTLREPALQRLKQSMVTARKNDDEETAKVLSQVKSFIKRAVPTQCNAPGCDRITMGSMCHLHIINIRRLKRNTGIAALVVCLSGFSQPSPLSAPANPPVKKSFLTWDRDGNREWKIYTGPARGAWTNSMFTSTNFIPYQQGIAYGVSSLDSALNVETAIINYPSNRVAQLVIEARDIETGRMIETPWLTYTNAATGSGKMMRLREDFLRWE